jgi:hypothetical protein
MDLKELLREIDFMLISRASMTPEMLARELGVKAEVVEQAVREIIGTSFREYLESKKLAHALKVFEERRNGLIGQAHGHQRAERRTTIPGATVSYLLHGRGIRKSNISGPCPLYDLSKAGMAFFSDYPLRPGRELSLLIECAKLTGTLRLRGRVAYAVAENIANQYRLGVRFKPFEARRGYNPPKSLDLLTQLLSMATSSGAANCDQSLP